MENQTFVKKFRTSEGKNGKLNYSRNYPTQKTAWVRSSLEDFNKFASQCVAHDIEVEGRFTIHSFTFNRK